MTTLTEFRAGAAEDITGMGTETQRVKRRRGQLTPVESGKARLNAVTLSEMVFVQEASKLGLGTANLTVRGVAARWIAFWALLTPDAHPDRLSASDRERVTRKLLQLRADQAAPEYAVLPTDSEPTWKYVVWTSDPITAVGKGRLSVIVNLKVLGEQMAARAGALVESSE